MNAVIASPLQRLPYAEAARSLLRQTVLAAVHELIGQNGWAATSITTVAKAAGVSRQTIYNEFGSRRSIAEAYILDRLDTLLDAVAENVSPDSVEPGLRGGLELFFRMVDEPLIQTVLAGDRENLIELLTAVNERTTKRLADILLDLRPGIDPGDAEVFADSLARIAAGHAIAPTLPRKVAIERMVRLVVVVLDA